MPKINTYHKDQAAWIAANMAKIMKEIGAQMTEGAERITASPCDTNDYGNAAVFAFTNYFDVEGRRVAFRVYLTAPPN